MSARIRSLVNGINPIDEASRDDLTVGDLVTVQSLDAATTYSWVLQFVPEGSTATFSGSPTAVSPGTFTVDVSGAYLIRLTVDVGLGTESTQYIRARYLTSLLGLKLIAAGEKRDSTGIIPVDVDSEGWANEQNFNLKTLEAAIASASPPLSTVLSVGDTTSGENIIVSNGDEIRGETPLTPNTSGFDLVLRGGAGTGTGVGGDIVLNPGTGATPGEVVVNGKLTVTGLIDPTGIIFDQAAAPATTGTEGAIFVSDGSGGLTLNGLYYRPASSATPVNLTAGSGVTDLQGAYTGGRSIVLSGALTPVSIRAGAVATASLIDFLKSSSANLASFKHTATHQFGILGADNATGQGIALLLQAGAATGGVNNGGDIRLRPGVAFGGGTDGLIVVQNPTGTNAAAISIPAANTIQFQQSTGGGSPVYFDVANGDVYLTGYLYNPKAIRFEQQATLPTTGISQGAIFVSDGSGGLTADHPYYRPASNGTPVDLTATGGSSAIPDHFYVDTNNPTGTYATVALALAAVTNSGSVIHLHDDQTHTWNGTGASAAAMIDFVCDSGLATLDIGSNTIQTDSTLNFRYIEFASVSAKWGVAATYFDNCSGDLTNLQLVDPPTAVGSTLQFTNCNMGVCFQILTANTPTISGGIYFYSGTYNTGGNSFWYDDGPDLPWFVETRQVGYIISIDGSIDGTPFSTVGSAPSFTFYSSHVDISNSSGFTISPTSIVSWVDSSLTLDSGKGGGVIAFGGSPTQSGSLITRVSNSLYPIDAPEGMSAYTGYGLAVFSSTLESPMWRLTSGEVYLTGNTSAGGSTTTTLIAVIDGVATLSGTNTTTTKMFLRGDITAYRTNVDDADGVHFPVAVLLYRDGSGTYSILAGDPLVADYESPVGEFTVTMTLTANLGLQFDVDQGAAGGDFSWDARVTLFGAGI